MKKFFCFVSILALTAVFAFAAGERDDKSSAGSATLSAGNDESSNLAMEQKKDALFREFTAQERIYIKEIGYVRFSADPNNKPASFYNSKEHSWQGMAFDVLIEIEGLTGLTFEIINDNKASYLDVINLVDSDEAYFFPALNRTSELRNHFIWPESSSDIVFVFNQDEQILCSIFDKALRYIDMEAIQKKW